ncbi:ankyrin repeat-containing protein [Aspergillus bombycis]|uniref:Ankyrin repeat-containing protein n=1 Tax=Aspergillus bombycis TaxID=109264 RepID=A0A1F8ACS3_9EURO|nr:ankyrin repeat-containing protein [Aspergillus bombycis]OGM49544.1 ankyrin repeat-containing protein [Aspergillus bombycis]
MRRASPAPGAPAPVAYRGVTRTHGCRPAPAPACADIASVDERGDAAIHHAAAGGSVEVVKFLLEQGIPVDVRGDEETTVLLTAVIYQRAAVVQLLLEAGADVNLVETNGNNALHLAAYCGTVEIVESLLAHSTPVGILEPDGQTVLHAAVAGNNPSVVPSLCRAGVAINALDASGNTALHLAALYGCTAFARLLLEMGADVSVSHGDGKTALHLAAWTGQEDLLQLLVDAGAEVGALHRSGGHTALHYAAVEGGVDAFRVLLHAANAQKFDWLRPCWCGGTVLSKAATKGHRDIIELIVESGVDVTACYDGSSALHAAAAAGQTDLVEFLLSLGADRLQLDWFGRSSIDWAVRHPPTLETLIGDAPLLAPSLDEEKRTSALREGITTLATRALTEARSVSYRLGKCLLYMGDVSAARTAFLYDANVDPSFSDGAVCDLCKETAPVTEGRFVCQTCPDIDLCGQCMDQYYQERLQIRLCDGHQFLEVQASSEELLALQPNESRESWLHGLIAMYDSSA